MDIVSALLRGGLARGVLRGGLLVFAVGVPAGSFCQDVAGPGSMVVRVPTADIQSTYSQQAARTTTETAPFHYELEHPEGLTLLFNGYRGSKIEPCGCRALNLGGIDKEAAMVQTIRHGNGETLLMDAGGYFREFADPAMRLQTWHMLRALKALDCRVMNVGFPDLQQGLGSLEYFRREFELPLISANIVDGGTDEPIFDAFKEFEFTLDGGSTVRLAVVGVTEPNRDASRGPHNRDGSERSDGDGAPKPGRWMIAETNGVVPWMPFAVHGNEPDAFSLDFISMDGGGGAAPAPVAGGKLPLAVQFAVDGSTALTSGVIGPYRVRDWVPRAQRLGKELRGSNDLLVLLAYTSFERAVRLAPELSDYDLIIAADYIDRMEPVRPVAEGPLVVSGDQEGKYLGIVELAAFDGERPVLSPADTKMLPVLQSIEPLPHFQTYLNDFTAMTEKLPVEEPVTALAEKIYAGSSSCRACHVEEFDQWKSHRHSHAMKTLVDRNMQFNPDCLQCHTVAYRQPGGFTDLRVTASLANVQCEVCHGPAQAHVTEMRAAEAMQRQGKPAPPMENELRMEWNREFCMQCHDPKNDPHFHFSEDILRVRHRNPAPPRERPTTMQLD